MVGQLAITIATQLASSSQSARLNTYNAIFTHSARNLSKEMLANEEKRGLTSSTPQLKSRNGD